jgi:hypothetical protein
MAQIKPISLSELICARDHRIRDQWPRFYYSHISSHPHDSNPTTPVYSTRRGILSLISNTHQPINGQCRFFFHYLQPNSMAATPPSLASTRRSPVVCPKCDRSRTLYIEQHMTKTTIQSISSTCQHVVSFPPFPLPTVLDGGEAQIAAAPSTTGILKIPVG